MKNILFLVLILTLFGCTPPQPSPPLPNPDQQRQTEELALNDAYSLGNPIEKGALTIVPIHYTHKIPENQEMATLAEAKAKGWISITELPGLATVEFLSVTNTGPKPILLLAGELLLGGKQDRVIKSDTVVDAGQTIKVSVYCVEQGRWTNETTQFESASAQVPATVRNKALYADQNAVWDSVAEFNSKSGYEGEVSSVRAGIKESDKKTDYDSLIKQTKEELDDETITGAIFALNGEVETMEIFGNHYLFKSSLDSLLFGYFTEAKHLDLNSIKTLDLKEVVQFGKDIINSQRKLTAEQNKQNRLQLDDEKYQGAEIAGKQYIGKPSESGSLDLIHGTYNRKK